jgi:heme-degrading monooxygenase HmoA
VTVVIVITRLRLSDTQFRDPFLEAAAQVFNQAVESPGNLQVEVLPDANDVYWTRTSWSDRDAIVAFMTSQPHRGAMRHISEWCDEATYVEWTQEDSMFPSWRIAFERLVDEGQVTPLLDPSANHEKKSFPPPKT